MYWSNFEQKLEPGARFFRRFQEKLQKNLGDYFSNFAVFSENINLRPNEQHLLTYSYECITIESTESLRLYCLYSVYCLYVPTKVIYISSMYVVALSTE